MIDLKDQKKLKLGPQAEEAAGLKAVTNSLHHIFNVMPKGKALRVLNKLNQKGGVDCPGCAWPDPDKRSGLGEYCENGVKAIAEEAMEKKADPALFEKYSVNDLLGKSNYWLGYTGRLTHPMIIREGETHYEPISWDEAYRVIGDTLNALSSPHEAAFYTSGRTSNEAAFLYQLFVRMYGTNNLPDCSNMCHESSGVALTETLGIGKGSVKLDDFHKAELILIFGQNPATNHPRMLSALEKAKQNGAKIVTINPLREAGLLRFKNPQTVKGLIGSGTEISDLYLQIRINEDVALVKAIMVKLLQHAKNIPSVIDLNFIKDNTANYELFLADLEQQNLQKLIARTGLKESEVNYFADLVAASSKIIACWGMGLTQHVNGVDNIREVVNLLLLKGSIGKEGAGTCPVRGHSNVQGDRTMGVAERPPKELLDKISANFGFNPPTKHGYSTIEAIEAMYKERVKVFIGMGGNFAAAAPDTNYTEEAIRKCTLTVQISTKLNRSHLVHGKTGIILPSMGRTDKYFKDGKSQYLTVENSMGVVHTTAGVLDPPSAFVKSEPVIVAELAKSVLKESKVDWDYLIKDYNNIRDLIEQNIEGFENFNERVKKPLGFELPNGSRVGQFETTSKKAHFTLNKLSSNKLTDDEFLMMTTRSHDQFNTTIYGLDDRYRGVYDGRMVVFMNRDDMELLSLKEKDSVTLFNNYDGIERKVEGYLIVPYNIPPGCVATYYPESNPLIPLSLFAHTSLTPSSKSVKVKIKKDNLD